MRFRFVFLINSVFTIIVIANAFALKKQFYPSVVYITKSKPSIAIIGIEGILLGLLYAKVLTKIFFNELTANEVNHLSENIWPILLETCLAFAIFQRAANYIFLFRILCLSFFKCFHLLAKSRMDLMRIVVQLPNHFHLRMIGIFIYLSLIDIHEIMVSVNEVSKFGLSIEIMFVFEYAILLMTAIHITVEYLLNCIEIRFNNQWDERVVFSNYLELIVNFFKTVFYVTIIIILSQMKHFPLSVFRPFMQTLKKFRRSLTQLVLSLRAIARIDRFPCPTNEDLVRDNLCVICRDEIKVVDSAKKLFCNHIFHLQCLKDWLRRQQRCPTCRSDIMNPAVNQNQNIPNADQENNG